MTQPTLTKILEGLDLFRPIQCYSCFQWCQHYRPDCPRKYEPQICSRCTQTGHYYFDCPYDPLCLNCGQDHPCTARICPEYQRAIETHKPAIAKQLANLILGGYYLTFWIMQNHIPPHFMVIAARIWKITFFLDFDPCNPPVRPP